MATFTEQAALSVVQKSTGPIKKINAALRDLFKTARQLRSVWRWTPCRAARCGIPTQSAGQFRT